jgi:heterodisulfide reductase subunit A-like polyferredoxin
VAEIPNKVMQTEMEVAKLREQILSHNAAMAALGLIADHVRMEIGKHRNARDTCMQTIKRLKQGSVL